MSSALAVEPKLELAAEDLAPVRDLYQQGLYVQAYEVARRHGELREWTGSAARVLAGRLAVCLGGIKLSSWHFVKAWRGEPTDCDACWFYVRHVLETRGPYPALTLVKKIGNLPHATAGQRAQWLSQHASILGRLRDFDAAHRLMKQALELDRDHPWMQCELSMLYMVQDRLDDALAAERRALEMRPWYRPAVQGVAHLLVQLERDQEALELLHEGCRRLESSHLWAQLSFLQSELRHYADARESLEQFARLSPLLEKDAAKWLAGRRSDAAYYCGDMSAAAEHARQAGTPFFEKMAPRLANPPAERKRVHWPVPFVRQHHMTCVPATLAALSRYWSMPVDHLEVAADICYDGTPHHSERRWAEEHGWAVREFTVTWDSAVALLDRGIPFTLTTTDPGNSHLQAVAGYDLTRGTLIIRDPGERHQAEFLAEALFERYRPAGPRGLALVPQAQSHLLDGLELPDLAMYDQMYRLQRALYVHRREEAQQAYRQLKNLNENHYLTWLARRSLAGYDADMAGTMACADGMLGLFPEDIGWRLTKVTCWRQLGQRDELLAALKELAERKPTDALCWQQYAQELSVDAREQAATIHYVRLGMRGNPGNPGNYTTLAHIRWDQRRTGEALELDRFAACLGDKDEGLAQNYFNSARYMGKAEEALSLLRERCKRLGAKSSLPARTLSWAYGQLDRWSEALAVLDEAGSLRREDGDLQLYTAEVHANLGDFERAKASLKRAEGKAKQSGWLRTAAMLAGQQGDRAEALALWQQVLQAEPLHLEAHRIVSQLLAESTGRAAALDHLRQACERFPYNTPLLRLWIEWLREDGPAAVEPIVRKLIANHGADAWARRELALCLGDQYRLPEAFAEMDIADRLESTSPPNCSVRGRLLFLAGRHKESQEAHRQAIRLSADQDFSIRCLLAGCGTLAERRAALAFVEGELVRQVIYGNGLLAFRDLAMNTLTPEELLTALERSLELRPDLWHAWSAVIHQLNSMNRVDDALVLARKAVDRFPLLPSLWLDLAAVHRRAKQPEGEIEVLQNALKINPGWGPALCRLAEVHEIKEEYDQACALLERAIARAPLAAVNHGTLADVLWKKGAKEQALERLQEALKIDPGYDWAWGRLLDWARTLGRHDFPLEVARELTRRRPGEARSWFVLARMLLNEPSVNGVAAERLAAIDKALVLNPRLSDASDVKAELLALDRRFDEALEACRPAVWGEQPPLQLRARAAWIVAQRGDLPAAIEQMRSVLTEDANYYWAWMQVAEWSQAINALNDYLLAAEHLVRLAPEAPVPFGFRGDARIRLGQDKEGEADLRHALELAPDYSYAGMQLFDRNLAAGNLDAAGEFLAILKKHVAGAFVDARDVQLSARRKDQAAAVRAFEAVCRSFEKATWPLDHAMAAMADVNWMEPADQVIRKVVGAGSFNPNIAAVWAQYCPGPDALGERLQALDAAIALAPDDFRLRDVKAERLADAKRFDEAVSACTPQHPETPLFLQGRAAWVEHQRGNFDQAIAHMQRIVGQDPHYAWGWRHLLSWLREARQYDAMADAAQKMLDGGYHGLNELAELIRALAKDNHRQAVLQFTKRFEHVLRADTRTWGEVGSGLGGLKDDQVVVDWLGDWRKHPHATPVMLINLAISLRGLARDEEAREAGQVALTLPPDYTTDFHRVWLSLDYALAGAWPALEKSLQGFDRANLDPLHAFAFALMESVRRLAQAPPGERSTVFAEERRSLAKAAAESEPVSYERGLALAYSRTIARLAELRGGMFAKLWSLWRRWRPRMPKVKP